MNRLRTSLNEDTHLDNAVSSFSENVANNFKNNKRRIDHKLSTINPWLAAGLIAGGALLKSVGVYCINSDVDFISALYSMWQELDLLDLTNLSPAGLAAVKTIGWAGVSTYFNLRILRHFSRNYEQPKATLLGAGVPEVMTVAASVLLYGLWGDTPDPTGSIILNSLIPIPGFIYMSHNEHKKARENNYDSLDLKN